ncbi:MAG: branched-chain amino acid ABC transporter permease [archaeon]|nr:branched-chain amino acid ABC transporter permease [archaeon]MCP8319567.1 branched-chain amino acid ABC transporter permease [archaeon]
MRILIDLRSSLKAPRFYLPILLLAISLFIPFSQISLYMIHVLILMFFYISYSSSWNLLAYSGQVSFGHAAFLGIGAYVTTLFTIQTSLPWVGILIGALASAFVGFLIGLTCVRLREWFLALVTFGFSIIMIALTIELDWLTGGTLGKTVPKLFPSINQNQYYFYYYYVMLALAVFSVFTFYFITKSKIGLAFAAIRENELEAKATGIDVIRYRLLAFTISAFFAGLTGALYAHFIGYINHQIYGADYSFWPIIITVIGGLATIEGPVIGSVLRFLILEFLRIIEPWVRTIGPGMITIYPKMQVLLFGAILVVVIILMPKGISSWLRKFLTSKG